MYKTILFLGITLCSLALINSDSNEVREDSTFKSTNCSAPDWGFFGHRRINRMAVFTLPPEMMIFYKKHIEFITDHSVDPDKRRYATRHEAVRHYIDIDMWGKYPYDDLPRNWVDALLKFAELNVITEKGDTIQVIDNESIKGESGAIKLTDQFLRKFKSGVQDSILYDAYRDFFNKNIMKQYYEEEWVIDVYNLNKLLGRNIKCEKVFAIDHFSEHGILPYHLQQMQYNLEEAFRNNNTERILRLSAEFGHYLGDAHVPLHTTVNYNGQLTNQIGIHGFWESRIPELFADKEYDFLVGKADYVEKTKEYFWDIVLTSHTYVDSVLQIEKSLSKTFPEDQQNCYDDRKEVTIMMPCKAYAKAFSERMGGMVEKRMRGSIHAIGSAWYTAWVNAGQPKLGKLPSATSSDSEDEALDKAINKGAIKGREHGS